MVNSVEEIFDEDFVETMSLATIFTIMDVPKEDSEEIINYLRSRKELSKHTITYSSERKIIISTILGGKPYA
ncbi:hypothetical protein K9L16_00740 [Candidatus Pacearchaeota archaeon]|nr:hypothetical protein [Candidatus Pacearchaeota archaeon]